VAVSPFLNVGASRYHELEAYKQAIAIADDVWHATRGWDSFDAWSVGIQLVRAADSVGANIAEGYGRYGFADQRRLLHVARGSAYETEHWIARAVARGLFADGAFEPRITELLRTLNGLIRSHRQR
jgi:four helix bundle protein